MVPTSFASRTLREVPLDEAAAVLSQMGYPVPQNIGSNSALQQALQQYQQGDRMTAAQISEFLTQVGL